MVRTCDIDGCDGEHTARGLCMKHYVRQRRAGLLPAIQERRIGCSIDSCQAKHLARGYCRAHYNKWWEKNRLAHEEEA